MKKGESKIISIPGKWENESLKIEVEFLGKGSFTTCYTDKKSVYSFVKTYGLKEVDYSKQGIALYTSNNPYIPDFKILGDLDNFEVFKSPLYHPLKKENKIAWNEAKILTKIWSHYFGNSSKSNYDINKDLIIDCTGLLTDELIEALTSINDAMSNYGDTYRFEFPVRNLAVDDTGHLILLDIIFNTHALKSFLNS
jgi:hypothetical protein